MQNIRALGSFPLYSEEYNSPEKKGVLYDNCPFWNQPRVVCDCHAGDGDPPHRRGRQRRQQHHERHRDGDRRLGHRLRGLLDRRASNWIRGRGDRDRRLADLLRLDHRLGGVLGDGGHDDRLWGHRPYRQTWAQEDLERRRFFALRRLDHPRRLRLRLGLELRQRVLLCCRGLYDRRLHSHFGDVLIYWKNPMEPRILRGSRLSFSVHSLA